MSTGEERTEEATPRRRAAALAQGMRAHSPLAESALAILMAALPAYALYSYAGGWPQTLRVAAEQAASAARVAGSSELLPAIGVTFGASGFWQVLSASWAGGVAAAVTAALACGSVRFGAQAVTPSLARLTRKAGIARLIAADGLTQACVTGLTLALLATCSLPTLAREIPALAALSDPIAQASSALGAGAKLWWSACATLAATGMLDVVVQRRRQATRLKMTQREVREEHVQTEGRPETRQRRRHFHAKQARSVRIAAIRRATAVITNPTRVAVALRYAPPLIDVPIVVARAADLMAPIVRKAAREYGVPVIEAPELARRLYEKVDVDEPIPEECYAAVAAVFTWILRTRGALLRGDEEVGSEEKAPQR